VFEFCVGKRLKRGKVHIVIYAIKCLPKKIAPEGAIFIANSNYAAATLPPNVGVPQVLDRYVVAGELTTSDTDVVPSTESWKAFDQAFTIVDLMFNTGDPPFAAVPDQ
jgi:hypothetical protein